MSDETECAICGRPVRIEGINHYPANLKKWGYGGEFAHSDCFSMKRRAELIDRVACSNADQGERTPTSNQWIREAVEMLKSIQWSASDYDGARGSCPECEVEFVHKPDCTLARLIRQGEAL